MDATRLRNGLRSYIDALQVQLSDMSTEGDALKSSWHMTREIYHGDGADVFAQEFERASKMLGDYTRILEQVIPILRQRLDALEQFDSSTNPSL